MSKRTLLILLATVLWFLFCHYRYTCVHKQVCWGCSPEVSDVVPATKSYGPLTFNSNSDAAITNEKFSAYKDSILAGMTVDNLLEIIGHYYPGEKAPPGFDNMGLARAAQIKALFIDSTGIASERIRLLGKEIGGTAPDYPFAAAEFSWKKIDIEKTEIVRSANSATIYFPSGSAKGEVDPGLDSELKQIAERVIQSGEKINLVGHADNTGSADKNQVLGLNRANSVSRILKSHGVPAAQITTSSKGDTQSIASNETAEGRHQNRRVELTISK